MVDWISRVKTEATIFVSNTTVLSIHGSQNAVIDGNGQPLFQVSSASLYLSDLSLENGNSSSIGGALWATSSSTLTLVNCNVSDNNATTAGGGIAVDYDSILFLEGVNFFQRNSAGYGGAIYLKYGAKLLVTGVSSFLANSAVEGGALAAYRKSQVMVTGRVYFHNNMATTDGGAVCGKESNLTISNSSGSSAFVNNSAAELGGAIFWRGFIRELCVLKLVGVVFDNNDAESAGAIYCSSELRVILERSRFSSNEARVDGGAMVMQRLGDADRVEVLECFWGYNYAQGNGGALVIRDASVTVANSTFTGNIAGEGSRSSQGSREPRLEYRVRPWHHSVRSGFRPFFRLHRTSSSAFTPPMRSLLAGEHQATPPKKAECLLPLTSQPASRSPLEHAGPAGRRCSRSGQFSELVNFFCLVPAPTAEAGPFPG